LSLRALRGYPVVLNFWASWCSPCSREAGLLAAAAKAERGRVVFLAVDVNDFTSDARRFLGSHRVPFVAVRSGSSISERFGLVGLPETFYVDRLGRIRGMTRGQVSAATLRRQIERAARA
jgi:cytochrome c biogenesis protein CcmG/thiol:disulfide interchange protein DsbE